jgi:hypothetical protein
MAAIPSFTTRTAVAPLPHVSVSAANRSRRDPIATWPLRILVPVAVFSPPPPRAAVPIAVGIALRILRVFRNSTPFIGGFGDKLARLS